MKFNIFIKFEHYFASLVVSQLTPPFEALSGNRTTIPCELRLNAAPLAERELVVSE